MCCCPLNRNLSEHSAFSPFGGAQYLISAFEFCISCFWKKCRHSPQTGQDCQSSCAMPASEALMKHCQWKLWLRRMSFHCGMAQMYIITRLAEQEKRGGPIRQIAGCYKWEGSRPAERTASPSGILSGGYHNERSLFSRIQKCYSDLSLHHHRCPAYNLPWAIGFIPFTDHMSLLIIIMRMTIRAVIYSN